MDEFYNKHYIRIDDRSRITDGWSDGPHPNKDTEGAILLNEKGGYQFRLLFPDGTLSEENPPLHEWDYMIPLYAYDGGVRERTKEEINADIAEIPIPEPQPSMDDRVTAVENDVADLTAAVEKGLNL